ncbi:MAG: hypothetical protein FJX76_19830 [Armatimonadetes bacterium]|nr:hypothetical protein [Armatimonadota bacterium]
MPFGINNDSSPMPIRPTSNRKLLQTSVNELSTDREAKPTFKINPYEQQASLFEETAQRLENSTGLLQVAQVAVGTVSENLRQMRELALTASREDLTSAQRASIQAKLQALVRDLNEMAAQASFNGKPLLDGSAKIPVDASKKVVEIPRSDSQTLFPQGDPQVASLDEARATLQGIDQALEAVDETSTRLGQAQRDIRQNLELERADTMAASTGFPRIEDLGGAKEAAVFASQGIITQSSTALMAQANLQSQFVLQLFGAPG